MAPVPRGLWSGLADRGALGVHEQVGYLDPDEAQDVAFVLAEVCRELGEVLDGIDPETVADAVRDAMEQRRPRC